MHGKGFIEASKRKKSFINIFFAVCLLTGGTIHQLLWEMFYAATILLDTALLPISLDPPQVFPIGTGTGYLLQIMTFKIADKTFYFTALTDRSI